MKVRRKIYAGLFIAAGMIANVRGQEDPARMSVVLPVKAVEQAVAATDVSGVGGFAGGRIDKNKEHYLKTFAIDRYIRLMEERNYTAWDWRQGEQPGKWLESAILTAARTRDQALEKEARGVYDRILRSQEPGGYIGITSPGVRSPDRPLRGMDAYELYFLQHALLTAYEIWKDPKGLVAAKKLGNYFLDFIGPGKAEFWPSALHDPENKEKVLKGTQHSELAGHSIHYSWEGTLLIDPMMRLYELTGDRRYYDWCKWVVHRIDKWSGWNAYSRLDSVAAGTMTIDKIQPYVHAHTFQMNFLGLLRMYQVSGDPSYLRKVAGAWNDVAARQMYITGGVSVGEHYEREHVKPLTGKMMETCATMSWMQLSQYLLDLSGDPKYADAMERICWNQVFAEQSIDGDANRYDTPPNGYVPEGLFREPDCCMSSGHRLLSMLPGFIYAAGPGHAIYINQFIQSTATIGRVKVSQQTNYPEDEKIVVRIDSSTVMSFTVNVRIPAWCQAPTVAVNGKKVEGVHAGQYAKITRSWKAGDQISIQLPMKLRWVRHDHYMKTSDRKPYKVVPDSDAPYALVRGPVVYAADDIWYAGDTADLSRGWMDTVKFVLKDAGSLRPLPSPGKEILGPGYEVPLKLPDGRKVQMPVYPFANIGKWYRDAAHKPDSNAAAWGYAIWLKGVDDETARGAASKAGPGMMSGLSVPKIFGNNMVLQRNVRIPVWGQAVPGIKVSVQFGTKAMHQEKSVIADSLGRWRVDLDPVPASAEPADMVISDVVSSGDGHTVESNFEIIHFRNILVGEVWLCSGQSNMEYSMRKNSKFEKAAHGSGPDNELNKADNPNIRIFLVRTNYSKPDTLHIRRAWDTAAGLPLRDFSAAGYFFAKELYRKLGVPIGIISSAVSGSRIEPWLPEEKDVVVKGAERGKFYETMIRPLAPFSLKGICWYQGESNCFLNDTVEYTHKMENLINSWRGLWQTPELAFYFVQIAPFYYSHSTGGDQAHTPESEPAFWEAQQRALVLPHTGMIVTTDLVDSCQDLHPAYKWEIGRRLALWALAKDYGMGDLVYSGPLYKGSQVKDHAIELSFSNTGGGLVSKNGEPLDWFEVRGRDGHWVSARAVIRGEQVVVSTEGIAAPVAVRFGWNEAAQANLYNKEGLPAMPFRKYLHE